MKSWKLAGPTDSFLFFTDCQVLAAVFILSLLTSTNEAKPPGMAVVSVVAIQLGLGPANFKYLLAGPNDGFKTGFC